jgi:inhibitor of cysteine peptidase
MALLCCLLFMGCKNELSNSSNISESSGSLKLKVGDTFVIKLESNPTTGYSWSLAESDSKVVKQVSSVYEPEKTAPNIVGSGGTEVWTFKAFAKGETKLTFNYARPWEKGIPPIKEEIYTIIVK